MYDYNLKSRNRFEVKIQSNIQRKIQIMQLISNEKRWYTFEEISLVINTSSRTIGKDLSYIKELIPENWEIQIQKGYGVQLLMPANASIEDFNCLFFRKSLTFKVLSALMEQGEAKVASLAEELYIQPYVVTKVLKKVERDIAHYNLRLQRNPLKIIGEEWQIILMFSELYSSAYSSLEWPFQTEKADIFQLIEEIEDSMDIVLCLNSRRFLSYFLAILLIRKQQNYEIRSINSFFYLNDRTPYYNKISICLNKFGQMYGMHFSDSEKIMLTIAFKCSNYIYKHPRKEKDTDIQIFKEHKVPIYNIVRDFIEMLHYKLGDNFIRDDKFIYELIVHFRKNIYRLALYPYIGNDEVNVIQYKKKKYFKTFLQVKEVYNKWIKKHKIASFVPETEIVNIVMFIEAARICNSIKPKKAIIVTKEGEGWKKYIVATLKNKFGNKIEFPDIYSPNLFRELDLEDKYDIDFIITTIPIKINSPPVIQIHPFVSDRDLHNIEYYIDRSLNK
ncbi:BglG family transcription antiterminator [Bacillus thuringiensis]|uniref:BglG family transcription antiterminator n=1 Tax=Bacillus thuringiensis TaxID=1428 RepID=UPI0015CF4E1A|nr:helix-turn-helix domain-containing protein [Bacillus thuringiensis]